MLSSPGLFHSGHWCRGCAIGHQHAGQSVHLLTTLMSCSFHAAHLPRGPWRRKPEQQWRIAAGEQAQQAGRRSSRTSGSPSRGQRRLGAPGAHSRIQGGAQQQPWRPASAYTGAKDGEGPLASLVALQAAPTGWSAASQPRPISPMFARVSRPCRPRSGTYTSGGGSGSRRRRSLMPCCCVLMPFHAAVATACSCYPIWMDFSECMSKTEDPKSCKVGGSGGQAAGNFVLVQRLGPVGCCTWHGLFPCSS